MRGLSWQLTVREWISQILGTKVAELEHARTEAWSTVWSCRTPDGRVWFKESTSANPAEGPVQQILADLAPAHVDAPLGWDVQRGWLLTPDGGTTLRDHAPQIRGMRTDAVVQVVRDYAQVQRATVDHGDALRGAGLPEHPPGDAATTLLDLASQMAAVSPEDPRHIDEAEHDRLRGAVDTVREAAYLLTSGPVPLSFEHSDLFPRNIFIPRHPAGPYRFFDFAESVWAHPFGSLLMLQWELVHRHGLQVGDDGPLDLDHPAIRQVFDAYLASWTDFADAPTLRALAAAALQLAPLQRAAVWLEVLRRHPSALGQHGATPSRWIFDVARPVSLG